MKRNNKIKSAISFVLVAGLVFSNSLFSLAATTTPAAITVVAETETTKTTEVSIPELSIPIKVVEDKTTGLSQTALSNNQIKDLAQNATDGVVVLPLSNISASGAVQVSVPASALKVAVAQGATEVKVETKLGTFSLPTDVAGKSSGNAEVAFKAEPVKSVPLLAKALSVGRPSVAISGTVNGKTIDYSKTPVKAAISYDFSAKDLRPGVELGVFMMVNGKPVKVDATYNEETGSFEFNIPANGQFFVGNVAAL